jgi:hypothetical protein
VTQKAVDDGFSASHPWHAMILVVGPGRTLAWRDSAGKPTGTAIESFDGPLAPQP